MRHLGEIKMRHLGRQI